MKTSASLLLAADVAIAGLTWYIIQTRRWKKIAEAAPAPPPAAEANDVSSVGACCPRKSKKGANGNGGSSTTLVPATFAESYKLEYSIHRPSALLRNDIELVFRPDLDDVYHSDPRGKAAGLSKDDFLKAHLLAVPTWQPAENDLSEISFPVNQERRALLDNFDSWVKPIRARLGQWSDVSCPMEGTARFGTPTSAIYNELEGLTQLLRYESLPIGCCGIVLHPKWQRRAYPVTFFTLAPLEVCAARHASPTAAHDRAELVHPTRLTRCA